MQVEFEIIKMRPASGRLETGSDLLASFEVDVFPFRLRNCNVRRRPSGELWVKIPGRKEGGISISSPDLIKAICHEASAYYMEKFDGART